MGMKRTGCVANEDGNKPNAMKNRGFRICSHTGYAERDDEKSEVGSTATQHAAHTDDANRRLVE